MIASCGLTHLSAHFSAQTGARGEGEEEEERGRPRAEAERLVLGVVNLLVIGYLCPPLHENMAH